MTPQELIDVQLIKDELDFLNTRLTEFTTLNPDVKIGGQGISSLFDTQTDDYKAALIVAVTALRDSKQTEFDNFVGTAV